MVQYQNQGIDTDVIDRTSRLTKNRKILICPFESLPEQLEEKHLEISKYT